MGLLKLPARQLCQQDNRNKYHVTGQSVRLQGRVATARIAVVQDDESEHVLSGDWDHYLFKLGDDLASIYLDLGIAAAAPVKKHVTSVRISVALTQPAENGMSTDAEFENLIALEDDPG